jgi:hypothetical protein
MANKHEEEYLNGAGFSRDQTKIIVFPVANQLGAAAVPVSDFGKPEAPRVLPVHKQSGSAPSGKSPDLSSKTTLA